MTETPAFCTSTGGHQFVTVTTLKQQYFPPYYCPGAAVYSSVSWWETVTRCALCGVVR